MTGMRRPRGRAIVAAMARWGIAVACSVLALVAVMVVAGTDSAGLFLHPTPLLPLDPLIRHLYSGMLGLALGGLVVVFTPLLVSKVKAAQALHETLRPIASAMSPWSIPIVAPASALVEELLFRGWLQPHLEQWLFPSVGILLQALLFGLVHYAPQSRPDAEQRATTRTRQRLRALDRRPAGTTPEATQQFDQGWRWAWVFSASLLGLVLGGMFALSGSLVGPLVAHAMINGLNLRYLRRHDPGAPPRALGGLLGQRS